jgi:hypothetical protein
VQHFANYTVGSGQTWMISSPTTIIATGHVEIDGTVVIGPGGSLAIFARSVTISGSIEPAAITAASAARMQTARRFPLASPAALPPNVIVSDTVVVASGATLRGGGSGSDGGIDIAAQSPSGTVTIEGNLLAQNGAPATTSSPPLTPGGAQAGGAVEIGTQAAIGTAGGLAALAGTQISAFEPASVNLTASADIGAGNGGAGYSDVNGALAGTTVTLNGTDGAPGGNVDIAAGTITMNAPLVAAGDGGRGGSAGVDSSGAHFSMPVDGKSVGQAGLNVVGTVGGGGNGGNVNLSGAVKGSLGIGGGGGGTGVFSARAGNGGPGGNGGTTVVIMHGDGSAGTPSAGPPIVFRGSMGFRNGGSGGNATTEIAGGNGGSVSLSGPGLANYRITFQNYANAGDGYGSCLVLPIPAKGTNGGTAANLSDAHTPYSATNSFNGGSGGDGETEGGVGTPAGTDDNGKKIGTDGQPGILCGIGTPPTATPTPTPTPTPAPSPSPSPSPTPAPSPTAVPSPTPSSLYGQLTVAPTTATTSYTSTQSFTVAEPGFTGVFQVVIGGPCSLAPPAPSGPGPQAEVATYTGGAIMSGQMGCVFQFTGPNASGTGSVSATYTAYFTP